MNNPVVFSAIGKRLRGTDTLALAAILAVAAASRFARLDLMEFKGDEANACRLALHVLGYSEPGVGRFFPTAGLTASIGLPNPPLFVYLMALPLAIVRSPIAAAAFVAATNVLAIAVVYFAGRKCYSRFVGIVAAALLALSPWGIVFSRKIWAQDLLPLCTAFFVLQLHALLVERRPRAAFWLIVIASVATQLHFSAWVLVIVLAVAFFVSRGWVDRRWLLAGLAVAALMYVPFLVYHAADALHVAAGAHHHHVGPGFFARFKSAGGYMLSIVGGGGMGFLLGQGSTFATVLSDVAGIGAIIGLMLAARRATQPQLGSIFLVWYALPIAVLTIMPVRSYMHYFIILLPLPYFGLAYIIERLVQRKVIVGALAFAVLAGSFALFDVRFFRTVIHDGGAPGDYGVAYRYTEDAVSLLVHRNPARAFEIGADIDFKPVRRFRNYRFLIWNAHPNQPVRPGRPQVGYVLVDTFTGTPPLLAADPHAVAFPRTKIGPLEIVTVPLGK